MSDHMFTVKEAADYLRIPVKTLYKLTAARAVPFTRPGGTRHIRFTQEHLDTIAANGEQRVISAPTRLQVVASRTARGNATGPRPPAGPPPTPKPPKPKAASDAAGRAA